MIHARMQAVVVAMIVLGGGAAGAYREGPVTGGGTIAGRVHVRGDVAPLPPQPVFKEKEFCGDTTGDDRLQTNAAGDVAGAVVYLVGIEAGKPVPRTTPVELRNQKCAFVPHVVAASVGQTLEIKNEDPFLHDAHAILGPETLFNLAIPKGRTVHHVLEKPGIIHVTCNVRHTWMHAYLFVTDQPYVAATDASGRFSLDQVPPGTYRIAMWHELLGAREREVTVTAGRTATVDFELETVAPEKP
jgi:plastocyanin